MGRSNWTIKAQACCPEGHVRNAALLRTAAAVRPEAVPESRALHAPRPCRHPAGRHHAPPRAWADAPPSAEPAGPAHPEPPEDSSPAPREKCLRCYRALCICAHLPAPAETRTRFLLLQSRTERFSAISTARIAGLGLSSCDIVWDVQGAEVFPEPSALLAAGGVGLLYPGEGSVVLGPGASAPRALVVLDGTWSQARRILRKNEWLRALPQFALAPSPEERSNYRIRRQPAEHCLSTVECIARVLQAVEPDRPEAPELLLRAFDAMVDTQINCIEKNVAGTRRFHSKKAQRRSAAPEAGADAGVAPLSLPPQPRTCVVYSYLTGDAAAAAAAHWVALRTDTGEFFEARVRVQRGAEAAAQAAAPGEEGEEALGVEEFGREWDRFVLGCERIALWNVRGLESLVERAARPLPARPAEASAAGAGAVLKMKAEYARSIGRRFPGNNGRKPGSLIDSVEREGLSGRAAEVEGELGARGLLPQGRARSWLAGCCAIAEFVGAELQQLEAAERRARESRRAAVAALVAARREAAAASAAGEATTSGPPAAGSSKSAEAAAV